MNEIDDLIQESLASFSKFLDAGGWSGRREREAVSLYAFEHLLPVVKADSIFHSPGQMGIEVPVPQIRSGARQKRQVCKDLVLWPEPAMTCWDSDGDPTVAPMAILEWKYGSTVANQSDVAWLKSFTSSYPDCTGYAIVVRIARDTGLITCTRVYRGVSERNWLRFEFTT